MSWTINLILLALTAHIYIVLYVVVLCRDCWLCKTQMKYVVKNAIAIQGKQ